MADNPDAIPATPESWPQASFVVVPDHELLRLIGKGSYGEVWLGRNTLGAYRAIKIVYEKNFRHKRPFDREYSGVQKFEPVSRLHDGLMDVLHVGRNDAAGYFYCVMELADDVRSGQTIDPDDYSPRTLASDIAKHKRLPVTECQRIGIAVASALEFLHNHGLIHRDVKPSNIVFVNGVPKLADIGLVAEVSEARSYVGTEGFIPPEGPGTVQADIYSLGKVLYEISTGKDRHDYPEFPTELGEAVQHDALFDFNKIVLKACRADPRQRYKTAEEMLEDLFALQNENRPFSHIGWRLRSSTTRIVTCLGIVAAISWWAAFSKRSSSVAGLPPGLVSLWQGENSTKDATGRNHGTIAGGGSVMYGPGVIGQAFVFDGIHRARVDVGNPVSLQLQDFTIAAWIKRSNPTNISLDDLLEDGSMSGEGGVVFGYGHTGYVLGLVNDGRLLLGAMSVSGVFSSNVVADTNWHHVAVAKAGTNTTFYIDGAASDRVPYDATFYFDSPVAIGSGGGGLGSTFFGMIDELAIFNRPLSSNEIHTIYNIGSAGVVPTFEPPTLGLVGWWAAEGNADDIIGNQSGKLINGTTFAAGKVGRAFSFDGKNQYVKIPRTRDLNVGKQITIGFWMKADAGNPMQTYQGLVVTDFYGIDLSNGYSSRRVGVNFGISTDGGIARSPESYPDTADANDGGAVVKAGEWYHIVGTYDGAKLQLYIDGQPWGNPMIHSGDISPIPAKGFLSIGSEDGTVLPGRKGRYFKGLIDEVCIYNRALTLAEIETIYKAGSAGLTPSSGKHR